MLVFSPWLKKLAHGAHDQGPTTRGD
jgi:hypothetical protein